MVQVTGPADPLLPTRVRLAVPTALWHRRGTVLDVINVAPQPTPPTQLLWDTLPGDVTGALASPGAYAAGFMVGVSGGPPPVAFHRIARYDVVSDPVDGYFSLPPLHRLAQVQLEAAYPAPPVDPDRRSGVPSGGATGGLPLLRLIRRLARCTPRCRRIRCLST